MVQWALDRALTHNRDSKAPRALKDLLDLKSKGTAPKALRCRVSKAQTTSRTQIKVKDQMDLRGEASNSSRATRERASTSLSISLKMSLISSQREGCR